MVRIQENLPNLFADGGPAGLAKSRDVNAFFTKPPDQQLCLRGLSASIGAIDNNEFA
jgi:hypothetical protein